MNYRFQTGLSIGLLLLPCTVFAHTLSKGVSPFMNGLMYAIFVPSHLICLIAIGLLLGQQGPNQNLKALIIYPVVSILGLLTAELPIAMKLENIILIAAMILGLLIVISPSLPRVLCAIAAAFGGFIIGLDSVLKTQIGMVDISAMFGACLGIILLPLLAMEFADYFRVRNWQRIGIRILGSWIAASAFLVLALSFSPAKI